MKEIKIAPSILAADFLRLGDEVAKVLEGGADYIHVDVMDGCFVPNISTGIPVMQSLRRAFPEAFFDVHMMVTRPGRYVGDFCEAGASHVTIHAEADTPGNITKALDRIRGMGVHAGLSLKPATPVQAIGPWLSCIDMVLVMTVEPGFGGQHFMKDMLPKIRTLRERLDDVNPACDIEVDGGITVETAGCAKAAGANVLVSGSAVYGGDDYRRIIRLLREK